MSLLSILLEASSIGTLGAALGAGISVIGAGIGIGQIGKGIDSLDTLWHILHTS